MNRKALFLGAVGTIVVGLALTDTVQRAHAQSAPATDDCWLGGNNGVFGNACEHVFKDGSKCVVFSRLSPAGTISSPVMQCKITQVTSPVPQAPDLTVS
jgi:hypothetical protein